MVRAKGRVWWVLAFALFTTAFAAPVRAELVWVRTEGADGCVDAQGMSARLGALGVRADKSQNRRVEGVIEPLSIGYRARLRVLYGDGQRTPTHTLESVQPDCSLFTRELVWRAALLLADARGQPPPMPAAEPRPAPVLPVQRIELGVHLGVTIGLLYGPGVGPGLSFRFSGANRLGGLFGVGFSANGDSWHVYDNYSRTFYLYSLHSPAALCYDAVRGARFLLTPCAGVMLGALLLDDDESAHLQRNFFASAMVGARAAVRIGHDLRIFLDLYGSALLTGPVYRFGYVGEDIRYEDVYRPKRVQLFPAIGVAQGF